MNNKSNVSQFLALCRKGEKISDENMDGYGNSGDSSEK